MKLPLYIHWEWNYHESAIFDADKRLVGKVRFPEDNAFAASLVHKMNRNWRYRFFGQQPYEYTAQDWFFERNTGVK